MKSFKIAVVLSVVGSIILASSILFADEAQERAKIKTLNNSAAAMMPIKPELALQLVQFANEEAKEINENKMNKKKPDESIEAMKTKRQAHIKLLRDSADLLKKSYPDLAEQLTTMADASDKKDKQ